MTREVTGEIRPVDIGSALDDISIGLDELTDLLQLYDEHREDELAGVDPKEPYTAAVLIARQGLGLALLRAIEDKASRLQEFAASTTKKAYELARSTKGSAAESEG